MDPWHDYLALPIAPFVLLVQAVAFFLPRRPLRWALALACPVAILAMFLYVASLPVKPSEGVNIGAGVLLLWMGISAVLFIAAVVVEAVRLVVHQQRSPRFTDKP
jgi:hypothetical protein